MYRESISSHASIIIHGFANNIRTKNIYLNGEYARKAFPMLVSKSTNLSRKLRDAYDIALQQYDVLITPTLPYIATSHCEPGATPLEQIAKQVGLVSNSEYSES